MTDVRRADPVVRRIAALVLLVGASIGALLILGFERYHTSLRDWILAEPEASSQRVNLVFVLLGVLLLAPLVAFAAYVWSLGQRVLQAREFPPPGLRVIRDTPVITGDRALSRGRLFKAFALGCGIATVAFGLLLWRLASLFSGHAA